MHESGCVFSSRTSYVVNSDIYVIASYNFFCKQTIMLHNKPKTITLSSVCGSESSQHIPQIILLSEGPDYIGTHQITHAHNIYYIHVQRIKHVW